jgi:16S rRNA (cytosine1402-N4)-methyltransferase
MLSEVREALAPRPGAVIVDTTVGAGGHAAALLADLWPDGRLIGLDQDPDALAIAEQRLSAARSQEPRAGSRSGATFTLLQANFRDLKAVLAGIGVTRIDGILFDLGVSSMQLDRPERGFSFRAEGPLDMRMGPEAFATAAQLVQELPEAELARIFFEYGEERWSRRIARRIVERRRSRPFTTTADLASVVRAAIPTRDPSGIDPATRVFQALRIAVNRELEVLEDALVQAAELLAPGGRLAVLSYHSLEDRIVKQTLAWLSGRCRCPKTLPVCTCGARPLLRLVTRKPLVPTEAERHANPRSRSAKLRVAERLASGGLSAENRTGGGHQPRIGASGSERQRGESGDGIEAGGR